MKIAAIITFEPERETSERAILLQGQLIERFGARLQSVRLAQPRLFDAAARAAIAERPDVLVAFCDGRFARRVGQIGYDHAIPIGMVCETAGPVPASPLCSEAAQAAILGELARGTIRARHVDVMVADGRVFFAHAAAGLAAHLLQWRARTAPPDIGLLDRFAVLYDVTWNPAVRIRTINQRLLVSGAIVGPTHRGPGLQISGLHCAAEPARILPRLRAGLASLLRRPFAAGADAMRFDTPRLSIDAGPAGWIALDGEPMRHAGAVDIRVVPRAIEAIGIPVTVGAEARAEPELGGAGNSRVALGVV